ncbi:synaptotagmin-1-like isoform X2 [Acanthaster planci]|nr:synaptotagmin-1-like isoform X2 [Acanthaster planci]XP_022099155.1 synaptotagmin-1-like isoform X2 [Acanthaster planci]XP_022099156.1 synaptotagmin-1-like isoform X2 [Acanthaster planci]XP_022099157.1 synaptotagmin-1-like isoform X2 [Acanthaster planci]
MQMYLLGVVIALGVVLCIVMVIAAYLFCRHWGFKLDPAKEERYNDFLNRVQHGGQDSVAMGLKKAAPRRVGQRNGSRLKASDPNVSPGPPVSPVVLNSNYSFTIPKATSPGFQGDSFTLEKPQPAVGALSPTSKTPSMMARLDPAQLDPSAHMYKENHTVRKLSADAGVPGPSLGIINFSLKYNPEMGLLTIRLIQARDLQPREFSGTADPYCKISVVPHSNKTLQSKVHRKTLCPEFKESFVFEIPEPDIHRQTARIQLFDFDQFSRDECIGTAVLALTNVDLSEKVEVWKEIKAVPVAHRRQSDEAPELGDIMFSLAYLPSAERLTVVILKARNLKAIKLLEDRRTSDPYIKVSIFCNTKRLKKKKTSTKHNTVHPVFNEALVFNVVQESLRHLTLEFQIIHENRIGQNEVLGRAVLGPDSQGEELAHWNDMISSSKPVARWHRLIT